MDRDLTPAEVHAAASELAHSEGGRAYHIAMVLNGEAAIHICFAGDISGRRTIKGEAGSWRGALANISAAVDGARAKRRAETIRRMALKIIDIADGAGTVSDRALRCEDFAPDEVSALSAEACALANEMAGRGPFVVVRRGSSNHGAAA